MPMPDLKTLLKDNTVSFAYYRKGYMYYTINELGDYVEGWGFQSDGFGNVKAPPRHLLATYIFPVPLEDVGDATFNATEKALLFMRYIRKAQEEGSFVPFAR